MDKLYNNFKISAVITLILIILAVTWMLLDYYVLKDILTDSSIFTNWEVLILKISLVVFGILIFSQLITLYYSFRIGRKGKTLSNQADETKKIAAENEQAKSE
ncbi:MAG: hypothetical protein GXO87_13040 [Chlorobi bacterium]|nr:hypothetical protein [Chlorobiota bacterium]